MAEGRKVTSTPMDKANQSMPPRLVHNASRILGYDVSRRADRSTMAHNNNDTTISQSSSVSTLTPDEQRRVLYARYLHSAFADAKSAERLKKKEAEVKKMTDALTSFCSATVKEVGRLQEADVRYKTLSGVREVVDFLLDPKLADAQDKLHKALGPLEAVNRKLSASMNAVKTSEDIVFEGRDGATVQETFESLLDQVQRTLAGSGDNEKFAEAVSNSAEVIRQFSDGVSMQTDDLNNMVEDMRRLAKLVQQEAYLKTFLE